MAETTYQGKPGQVARHASGSRAVLWHRKSDGTGWWIRGGGGLADRALASDDWELTDEVEQVPSEKERKVESFAERSGRHRRLAEGLIGADDPIFAIADLLVDHDARLDRALARIQHLEARLDQQNEHTP